MPAIRNAARRVAAKLLAGATFAKAVRRELPAAMTEAGATRPEMADLWLGALRYVLAESGIVVDPAEHDAVLIAAYGDPARAIVAARAGQDDAWYRDIVGAILELEIATAAPAHLN